MTTLAAIDRLAHHAIILGFKTEGSVGGMVSLPLAGVRAIFAPQGSSRKHQRAAALAHFSRLGLVGGIDPVGGRLEELADELGGGYENGGAQQFFQVGHEGLAGLGRADSGDQLFEFLFPGEGEGPGVRCSFLTPALRLPGQLRNLVEMFVNELLETLIGGNVLPDCGNLAGDVFGDVAAVLEVLEFVIGLSVGAGGGDGPAFEFI
ncbi:MAG: hypothetical protein WCP35_19775 [Verrucomicrobiota bacterium]